MHRSTPQGPFLYRHPLTVIRFAAIGLLASAAIFAQAQDKPPSSGAIAFPDRPILPAGVNPAPDANDQMRMQEQQSKKDKFEAANALRRKQIADDAAKLLALATELKTAVDKTDKDTLSIDVIRKADTIERLAKGVKDKMKLTVGAS